MPVFPPPGSLASLVLGGRPADWPAAQENHEEGEGPEKFLHHLVVYELSKLGPLAQHVHLLAERNLPCHHMLHLP